MSSQLLIQCWDAVEVDARGRYAFAFEAIVLPGTEGGIFARSRKCPDHRLGIDYGSDKVRARFEKTADTVGANQLGKGVRVKATAVVLEQRTDHYIIVNVTEIQDFGVMSEAETSAFIREFNIG